MGNRYLLQTAARNQTDLSKKNTNKPNKFPNDSEQLLKLQKILGNQAVGKLIHYSMGATREPSIQFDEDFIYKMNEDVKIMDYLSWIKWGMMLEGAQVIREDLEDATIAYNHYRENTGKDLYIDYEKAYREDKIIQSYVDDEIKIAQMDAEKILTQIEEKRLYSTTDTVFFSMTGKAIPIPNGTSENWQKTVGAHYIWGSADVIVQNNTLTLDIIIRAIDRYNFNKGQKDIASSIPDDENGRFAIIGVAQSFLTKGELKRKITWTRGNNLNLQP